VLQDVGIGGADSVVATWNTDERRTICPPQRSVNASRIDRRKSVPSRLRSAALLSAVDGAGIIQLLSYEAAPEVADGRLQPVLSSFEPESPLVSLLHVERRSTSGKIRAFVGSVTRDTTQ